MQAIYRTHDKQNAVFTIGGHDAEIDNETVAVGDGQATARLAAESHPIITHRASQQPAGHWIALVWLDRRLGYLAFAHPALVPQLCPFSIPRSHLSHAM